MFRNMLRPGNMWQDWDPLGEAVKVHFVDIQSKAYIAMEIPSCLLQNYATYSKESDMQRVKSQDSNNGCR